MILGPTPRRGARLGPVPSSHKGPADRDGAPPTTVGSVYADSTASLPPHGYLYHFGPSLHGTGQALAAISSRLPGPVVHGPARLAVNLRYFVSTGLFTPRRRTRTLSESPGATPRRGERPGPALQVLLDRYGDPSTLAGFNCDMAPAPRRLARPRSAVACAIFLFSAARSP